MCTSVIVTSVAGREEGKGLKETKSKGKKKISILKKKKLSILKKRLKCKEQLQKRKKERQIYKSWPFCGIRWEIKRVYIEGSQGQVQDI